MPPLIGVLEGALPHSAVPGARTAIWRRVSHSLDLALRREGCPRRIRTPAALYSAIHGTPATHAPAGLTWSRMCGDITLAQLVLRLGALPDRSAPRVVTWNARWLRVPHSDRATRKRSFIQAQAAQGAICLLQETHWWAGDAALWGGLFPQSTVVHSLAREGPGRGPQGGVAIVVPSQWEVLSTRELVPSCALEVSVRRTGTFGRGIRLQSLYFGPSRRDDDVDAYVTAAPADPGQDTPLYAGGDLNLSLEAPRDHDETAAGQRLLHHWAARMSQPLDGVGHTRRGRVRHAAIDAIVVPSLEAWGWQLRPVWAPHLSDHALLSAQRTVGAGGGRRCTPAAIAAAPPGAMHALHTGYSALGRLFGTGLVHVGDHPGPRGGPGAIPVGELAPHDPSLRYLAGDLVEEDAPGMAGAEDVAHRAPWLPTLARWGARYLASWLDSWWRHWRRQVRMQNGVGSELQAAVENTGPPVEPAGSLLRWLRGWRRADGPLDNGDARRWMALWRREQREQARSLLPSRLREKGVRPPAATLHHRVGRGLFKGKEPPGTLRGRDGVAIVSPQARHLHLMDSRRGLWESTPDLPHTARHLLEAYGRRPLPHAIPFPDNPVPPLGLIAGVILRAGGSAPGMDSNPYEAYHAGAHFVATLLSQAFYLLGQGLAGDCEWVLGSNVDLLAWIPKTPGAAHADDLRPSSCPPASDASSAGP